MLRFKSLAPTSKIFIAVLGCLTPKLRTALCYMVKPHSDLTPRQGGKSVCFCLGFVHLSLCWEAAWWGTTGGHAGSKGVTVGPWENNWNTLCNTDRKSAKAQQCELFCVEHTAHPLWLESSIPEQSSQKDRAESAEATQHTLQGCHIEGLLENVYQMGWRLQFTDLIVYNINLPGTEDRYARFTIVNDKYTLKEKLNYNSNQEVFFKFQCSNHTSWL